ncbi:MAG: hypothetical protein RBS57_14975, partial [Desulforhabdus sp.]|nr:hypothetical protein [Desulforhabdus sp.]
QAFYVGNDGRLTPINNVEPLNHTPRISSETLWQSSWRHLVRALFETSGPLQWTLTIITGVLGIVKLYSDWQQRQDERRAQERKELEIREREREEKRAQDIKELEIREEERKNREHQGFVAWVDRSIRTLSSAEDRCQRYIELHAFCNEENKKKALSEYFDTSWLTYLRADLTHKLLSGEDAKDAIKRLQDFEWEWQLCVGPDKYRKLEAFLRHIAYGTGEPTEDVWQAVLSGFQILGVAAKPKVIAWIEQSKSLDDDKIRAFLKSSAAGKYLLSCWKHERNEPADPIKDAIRPRDLLPKEDETGRKRMPLGAEKAEYDHLLLRSFIETSIWNDIMTPKPSLCIVSPGAGRTAHIWKAREEPPKGSFPVYMHVAEYGSESDLAKDLQQALALAWRETIVKDPYALLGLEEGKRSNIVTLLLQDAGGQENLFKLMENLGLNWANPDSRLLEEVLAGSVLEQSYFQNVIHLHPYDHTYTLLLVDVSADVEFEQVVTCLLNRWLPILGPCAIIPKVFVHAKPSHCPVAPVTLRWSQEDLLRMLRERDPSGKISRIRVRTDLEKSEQALIQASQGSPQRLIALGNALLLEEEDLPLDEETFNRILERHI